MLKVTLGLDEYPESMFFVLRMWYNGGKSTLDWRRASRRDIGDYMSNHMQGKLAVTKKDVRYKNSGRICIFWKGTL